MRPAGLSRTFEGLRGFVQTHPNTLTLSQGLDSSRRGVREVVRAGGGEGGGGIYGGGEVGISSSLLFFFFFSPLCFLLTGTKGP